MMNGNSCDDKVMNNLNAYRNEIELITFSAGPWGVKDEHLVSCGDIPCYQCKFYDAYDSYCGANKIKWLKTENESVNLNQKPEEEARYDYSLTPKGTMAIIRDILNSFRILLSKDEKQALENGISAVARMVPTCPIKNRDKSPICCRCHSNIGEGKPYYCSHCGQAINWEVFDED